VTKSKSAGSFDVGDPMICLDVASCRLIGGRCVPMMKGTIDLT
jgi:hypothetical protein